MYRFGRNNFTNELKNSKYIEALVEFSLGDWAKDEMAVLIDNEIFIVSYKYYDSFVIKDGVLIKKRMDDLSC